MSLIPRLVLTIQATFLPFINVVVETLKDNGKRMGLSIIILYYIILYYYWDSILYSILYGILYYYLWVFFMHPIVTLFVHH